MMTPVPATPPQLWHFRVSHYNEKVRWALDFKHWPHTRKALVPGFHLPVVRSLSGQNQVPILRIGKRILVGSNHILDEIERLRPEPPLFPTDAALRQRALALQAHFDDEVAPDLRRLFWDTYLDDPTACTRMATDGASPAARMTFRAALPVMRPLFRRNMGVHANQIALARQRLQGHFDRLEAEIGSSGYLVGDCFSVADLTAAAVMTAIIRPPEFSYSLPEPWPQALIDLRARIAHHPGFEWVLDIYRRHRGASSEIV
jgi:glutathione S-transferase